MPSETKIKIGEITTAIQDRFGHFKFDTADAYRPFLSGDHSDIYIELHSGIPNLKLGDKIFNSPPIWSLYRDGSTSFIHVFDQYSNLQRLLVLPPEFKRADLYFTEPDGQFLDPFYGPTMELFMINYLSQGYGAIIHACGIAYQGKGMLFAGESGAGKSTLANLWHQEAGAAVFSDDRTIVREIDGELWMFGTPWHGEAKFGSPRGVKLDEIYFLHHYKNNTVQASSAAETVMKLLQCSFPSFWDPAGMDFTMAFFEGLATRISCNDLWFKPDESAIEIFKRYRN
jgi:hypothetical protein